MNRVKKPLIILTGPTAVGKTSLSIALAKAVNGEIISADSMQVYRHMDVVRFQQMAKEAMKGIYDRGRIPVLVGGTGFYIQAVTGDIDFTVHGEDTTYRQMLEEKAKTEGAQVLHEMLAAVDPASAAAIHANNVKRVIRALEYYRQTGKPISQHNEEQRQKESPYNLAYFVLNDERTRLYERIDARIDQMLADGLIDEVKTLKKMGYHKGMVSMQGLGYKEILSYLDGTWPLEEAIYVLKRDTRHFAKRQITWFKRERQVEWFDKQDFGYDAQVILDAMLASLREKKIIR